jgi:Family of unknown function (DUF6913)
MLSGLKEKIAHSILDWKIKDKVYENQSFTEFFKKSFNFLILMPQNDVDFAHSVQVLNFLENKKKHVTIFTFDFRVSLLPLKYRPRVIEHAAINANSLQIPSGKVIDKVKNMSFQVAIDLNRKENLFYSYIISIVNAPIKVGFAKNDADRFYNLQIKNEVEEAETAYKSFLDCLEIFES